VLDWSPGPAGGAGGVRPGAERKRRQSGGARAPPRGRWASGPRRLERWVAQALGRRRAAGAGGVRVPQQALGERRQSGAALERTRGRSSGTAQEQVGGCGLGASRALEWAAPSEQAARSSGSARARG
jgi:hypothetical protein